MTAATTNSLFADDWHDHPARRRGRGATLQRCQERVLDKPNPTGRSKLTYRYRPLKRWESWRIERVDNKWQVVVEPNSRLDLVERGIAYMFQRIAGFSIADDEIVRLFHEALDFFANEAAGLDLAPGLLLRWAIDAKALSLRAADPDETRFKRRFIPRPAAMLQPKSLVYWLDQSDTYLEHRRKRREEQHGAEISRLAEDRFHAARRGVTQSDDQQDERRHQLAAAEQALLGAWDALPRQRQFRAYKAVEPSWHQQCANYGEAPDSPAMQDLLRILAAQWARDSWPPPADKPVSPTPRGPDADAQQRTT